MTTDESDGPSTQTEYVLVTEYFPPDTASTGQLMAELAVGLHERGLNVTVYTGQPNYHSGDLERQPRVTEYEGVTVRRIRAPQLRQTSLPRRLFNWTVFTAWMALALLASRSEGPREVLFVSNPPFLAAALRPVCALRGWAYTYVVYDLYPAEPVALGYLREGGFLERVWRVLDDRALRDATNVVALGQTMRARIVARVDGLDTSDVTVIHNWADGEFVRPREKSDNWFAKKHALVEPFTLVFSGNLAEFHDLDTLIRAGAVLPDRLDTPVRIAIIGDGDRKPDAVALAEELGVQGETVRFLPFQPREHLPYSFTAGDVAVVAVEEGFDGVVVSSKLYTAMAAGMPILAIAAPHDDEARLVDTFDIGSHVEQGDVDGVVAAVERWLENPGRYRQHARNAREAFERYFAREYAIDAYYDLLVDGTQPADPVMLASDGTISRRPRESS